MAAKLAGADLPINDYLPAFLRVTVPSVDRPFGIYVWDVFAHVCRTVLHWDPDTFVFVQGRLPLSTLTPVVVTITLYYVVILGGRELMRPLTPKKLNLLFQLHNVGLTFFSGLLLVLFVEQLLPIIYRHGLFYAICHDGAWTQPIVVLYYLNYLTKYVELLDTVFLVLKKKPLTFLHCYHHGATAALCYSQLLGRTSVSWVVICLNLLVHVVMYWYYFLSSRGIRVWWKEWVTRLQISQFIIDLGFVYFASYNYFVSTYRPAIPHYGRCAGEEFAAVYGCGLLTSYLFLFIAFYINVYHKRGKKASAAKRAAKAVFNAKPLKDTVVGDLSDSSGNEKPKKYNTRSRAAATGVATPKTRSRKA
ncbi:3-ketoacyl-CoA synthase/SUR4/fatty acid elongase [Dipodascopsis tothii]|uniref:3-ketoacyl-CoA synthase/SUR4/fatty acid elongase n=1 Tax=Dipodascopsis tothii TaxID=44089 RepID=UPI0034CE158F